MNEDTIIEINGGIPRLQNLAFKTPINWKIKAGENWAIIGANGAGKTLLIDILTSKHALKSGEIKTLRNESTNKLVKSVAFSDIYSLVDIQNSYYQQRWNAGDEHEVLFVKELFSKGDPQWVETLVRSFGIEDLIEKPINLLSSGELRKTLIIRSLLNRPRLLILDNPFIGLDKKSRRILNDVLERLSKLESIQIGLVLSDPKDLPECITHILPIKKKTLLPIMNPDAFRNNLEFQSGLFRSEITDLINEAKYNIDNTDFEKALNLTDILVRYGSRTILKDLNWEVKRGEKWALLGENGAGKSTLLSLISGDNPQAYANNITLFDRKRGSGESIWDIKKRIGYVSPEMHLYYLKNVKCLDVVGSGFFDTIGLYRKCNEEQEAIALEWMKSFGIDHIKDTSFLNISTGEQRLILLARVFVKNPDLLILDEPLHGLDANNKKHIKSIIEQFCTEEKSLIYVTHYEDEIPDVVTQRLVLTKRID